MANERGPERLFTFIDAVVAIAITLLVLPLVDLLATDGGRTGPARLFTERAAEFWAFLLSFAVIARLWLAHHRLGERVRALDGPSVLLNFGWVLAVVVLPFATQLLAAYPPDPLPLGVYVGTITAGSACLTVLDLLVVRREELRRPGREEDARKGLVASSVTTGLFALALLLGTTVHAIGYYGLLLPLLSGRLEQLVARARPGTGG